MGLFNFAGNLLKTGAKWLGFDTSSFENDEAQNFQSSEAQIGRDFQERMLQKQMEYSTDMWNKTNEYNTPKEQAERLREGGFNPATMTSGFTPGNATSSPSAPNGMSAPSAGSGHSTQGTSNPGNLVTTLTGLKTQKLNQKSIELDNQEKEIRNKYQETQTLGTIFNMMEDLKKKGIENNWLNSWYDQSIRGMMADNNIKQTDFQIRQMDFLYRAIETVSLPEQIRVGLLEKMANTDLLIRLQTESGYRSAQIWQDVLESTAREEGISLSNQVLRNTVNDLIEITKEENFWKDFNNLSQGVGNILGGIGSIASGMGMSKMLAPKIPTIKGFGR